MTTAITSLRTSSDIRRDRAILDLLQLQELGQAPGQVTTAQLRLLWRCSQPQVSRRLAGSVAVGPWGSNMDRPGASTATAATADTPGAMGAAAQGVGGMTTWYPPASILRALQPQPIEPAAGTGGLLLQAAALMRPELRNPPFTTTSPR